MEIPGFRSNICFLYKSLILFPLLFSTPSCITHTQSQESGVRIIEPLSTTHEITDLTSFIEKIELVERISLKVGSSTILNPKITPSELSNEEISYTSFMGCDLPYRYSSC